MMGDRWLDDAVRLRRENTPPGTSWDHAADHNARLEVTLCDECEKRLGVTAWRGHWLCPVCCEEDASRKEGGVSERACIYCEGQGCEECDGTGRRFRQTWETPDGVVVSASGSGNFNPALIPLFEEIAKAAGVELERRLAEGEPLP